MQPFKNPVSRIFLHIGMLLIIVYSTLPFVWTLLNSFKTKKDANARPPKIVFEPTLASYQKILLEKVPENAALIVFVLLAILVVLVVLALIAKRNPILNWLNWVIVGIIAIVLWTIPSFVDTAEFYNYFLNTIIICAGTIIISVSIGALAGYGMARYAGVSAVVIFIVAMGLRSLPRLGFLLPYFQLGQKTGLYDSYFLVILALVAIQQPFTMVMMRSIFMLVPRDLEEAAMIDGASRLGAFIKVIIPIMWPGIFAISLFTLLVSYHEFLLVRILTQNNMTLTVAMAAYLGGVAVPGSIPRQSAAAVISVLPLVIVVLIFQKQFVKGLTAGAVKG